MLAQHVSEFHRHPLRLPTGDTTSEPTPALSIEDFENLTATLITSISQSTRNGHRLDDEVYDKISKLLLSVGKDAWSLRPRTYAVLRMINGVKAMQYFVHYGLLDFHLPFHNMRDLPHAMSEASRHMFIEMQAAVLTDAREIEGGRHAYLKADADMHFTIIRFLGSGKFGKVDHVRSKLSLEDYARKRIRRAKRFSHDRQTTDMFLNELKSLRRLDHKHLVRFVGSYTDKNYIGILMTPVADYDLHKFLRKTPFTDSDRSLLRQFFGCLCSAVAYIHSQECRHKDIKPGNILVRKTDIYVTDFGTARNWNDQTCGTTTGYPGFYTPRFAAPEVINHEDRNQSADVWSLGCVFLDMITVLNGMGIEKDMFPFFQSHGRGVKFASSNQEALAEWLDVLETSGMDNQPVSWIRMMLKQWPIERPSAAQMWRHIQNYEDDTHVYYGNCCCGEDDYSSTDRASEFDDPSDRPLRPSLLPLDDTDSGILTPTGSGSGIWSDSAEDLLNSILNDCTAAKRSVPPIPENQIFDESPNKRSRKLATSETTSEAEDSTVVPKRIDQCQEIIEVSHDSNAVSGIQTLHTEVSCPPSILALLDDLSKAKEYLDDTAYGAHRPQLSWLMALDHSSSREYFRNGLPGRHWSLESYNFKVLDENFSPFSFGKWMCERVVRLRGVEGESFSFARRLWISLLALELTLVLQHETLSGSTEATTEDTAIVRKGMKDCQELWDRVMWLLRVCETDAYKSFYSVPNRQRTAGDLFFEKLLKRDNDMEPLFSLISLLYDYPLHARPSSLEKSPGELEISHRTYHIWKKLFPPEPTATPSRRPSRSSNTSDDCDRPPPLPPRPQARTISLRPPDRQHTYPGRSSAPAYISSNFLHHITPWTTPHPSSYHLSLPRRRPPPPRTNPPRDAGTNSSIIPPPPLPLNRPRASQALERRRSRSEREDGGGCDGWEDWNTYNERDDVRRSQSRSQRSGWRWV